MNFDIIIEFEDNKIKFCLNLPFEFMDINEDEYYNLDRKVIYENDNLDINCEELNKNIITILEQVKSKFLLKDLVIDENNFNFLLNDKYDSTVYEFIKKYPNLNILLITTNYQELINRLKDGNYPNLKIAFKNSDEDISYEEFYKMNYKLVEIVNFVNYYNLSSLEKVLLVYDIVKANEYKAETEDENYTVSRNLNQIINGDKIVCVGFANLMDYLLTNLGIQSNTITLEYTNKSIMHRRNYIHLKDDKYDINEIFFLDATWDSKKNKNYLDNYTFFLKPLRFFKIINENEIISYPSYFKILQQSKEKIIEDINNLNSDEIMEFYFSLSSLINKYKHTNESFISFSKKTKEELIQIVEEIYSKYNKGIPLNAFKNSLYKVRKIEYINNIIKFMPDEEYINSVCDRYYKETSEIKLLKILGLYDEPTLDKDLEEANATSVEEDLLRMRLLRTIKEKIQDIPQNDYIKKM